MTKSGLKLGFIGLGIMGTPMALNLIKGGHTLFVTTRRQVPQELLDAGAKACASAAEVARQADIVFHHGARHARCGEGAVRRERRGRRHRQGQGGR